MLILGHGGHATAVMEIAAECGHRPESRPYEDLRLIRTGSEIIVGLGCSDLAKRVELYDEAPKWGLWHATLMHPRAMAYPAQVRHGSVLFPGVILGAGVVVGRNVVIYSGSVVEHGSTIGDHAWLSPGVLLCGNVTVKSRAFLGAGAIVLPGVTIGEGARIGAGAVIHSDVPDGLTVFGPRDWSKTREGLL